MNMKIRCMHKQADLYLNAMDVLKYINISQSNLIKSAKYKKFSIVHKQNVISRYWAVNKIYNSLQSIAMSFINEYSDVIRSGQKFEIEDFGVFSCDLEPVEYRKPKRLFKSFKTKRIHRRLPKMIAEQRAKNKTAYDAWKLAAKLYDKVTVENLNTAYNKIIQAKKFEMCPVCNSNLKTLDHTIETGGGVVIGGYFVWYCSNRKCDFKTVEGNQ